MFWPDVVELRQFYKTPLGQIAYQKIYGHMERFCPKQELAQKHVLGIGYAPPYLDAFQDSAASTIAVMPAAMGIVHWPAGKPNRACLAEEYTLPFPDSSFDHIIVAHALEQTAHLHEMMREIWRILNPGGKVLLIIPNRLGIWSRMEKTPFGDGRPFTAGQIRRLLHDTLFSTVDISSCLYIPPTTSRLLLRTANIWEKAGSCTLKSFGGVLIAQAEKQIYAPVVSERVGVGKTRIFARGTRPVLKPGM